VAGRQAGKERKRQNRVNGEGRTRVMGVARKNQVKAGSGGRQAAGGRMQELAAVAGSSAEAVQPRGSVQVCNWQNGGSRQRGRRGV